MNRVFIIGGTTFDHIISVPEFIKPLPQTIHQVHFHETTGSTGSGKALCLKKLNVPGTLYSILGNDVYGNQIIAHLKKEGIDFIYDFDPNGTERHFNMMDKDGNRISVFITQSSQNINFSISIIEEVIKKSDVLVLNIISYCKQLIALIEKYKLPVWTDLHDYTDGNDYHEPFIDAADYVFLSSDNLSDYKKTMQNLINRGKELVVCTHGKNGSTAYTKHGEWFNEPALQNIAVVDANGAGDNYFSGFLWAHLQNKSLQQCMQYATICGALCITSQQLVADNLSVSFLENEHKRLY